MAILSEKMPYQLIRSRRKTISISFDKDVNLIVKAPLWVRTKDIEAFLAEKAEWIEATGRRLENARQKRLATRIRLENGDVLNYQGRELVLTVIREERSRAKVKQIEGRLLMWVPYDADYDYRQIQLEKWFRKEALFIIAKKAEDYAQELSVSYEDIRIKDQKSRWGSCSGKGNLNFNWRIIMAPESVCDYVIIHELCHLRHMDHSPDFWRLVESICPDYKKKREWLKEHAEELYVF